MLSTMESRKADESKQLAESLQKPAVVLEEMKLRWETIMSEQSETMKELVNQTVTTALNQKAMSQTIEEKGGASAAQTKFFE